MFAVGTSSSSSTHVSVLLYEWKNVHGVAPPVCPGPGLEVVLIVGYNSSRFRDGFGRKNIFHHRNINNQTFTSAVKSLGDGEMAWPGFSLSEGRVVLVAYVTDVWELFTHS